MSSSTPGRNPEAVLIKVFKASELDAFLELDQAVVIDEIYAIAATIVRLRDPEEGESALATLRISKEIALEDMGSDVVRYFLMASLEVLRDDASHGAFKTELLTTLRRRGMLN